MNSTIPMRASIASNVLAVFSGQLGTWVITAVTFLLIPRYLGPEGTGIMGIGWVVAGLAATAAGLGMSSLITREVARDASEARTWIATAIWMKIAGGGIAATISILLAIAVGYPTLTVLSVAFHALLIPAILVSSTGVAVFQGLEIMRHAAIFNVTLKLGILVGAVVAIAGDMGILGVIILTNAVPMFVAVLQLFVLRKLFPFRLFSFSRAAAKRLSVVSIPFFIVTISWAVYHAVDVFALSLLATEADVGFYSAPARVFGTLLFIPTTIAVVTFPRFASIFHENPGDLVTLADQVLRITVTASIAVTLGAIALSDDILIGILGSEFVEAGPVIVVMALSLVPTGVGAVLARMAFATNRQKAVAAIGVVALVARVGVSIGLILLFASRFGNPALGAVVGLITMEIATAAVMLRFAPRGTFSADALHFYLKVGASLAAAAVILVVGWAPLGSFISGLLAVAAYCAGVLLLRAYRVSDVTTFGRAMFGSRFSRAGASV